MRRLLAAAALVAFMPTANAEDKAKSDFSASAEYRARGFYMQNPGGSSSSFGEASNIEHRFRLGANFKANERISAGLTLMHNTIWGQGLTNDVLANHDTVAGGGATEPNFMAVNEAYMNWMVADDLRFKVGRFGYTMGDGFVISANDWEKTPYSFEGVLGTYEAEFGRFEFFGMKLYDRYPSATNAAANPMMRDPEDNAYGVNFDLKTKPEWLKMVNAHLIKRVAEGLSGTGPTNTATFTGAPLSYPTGQVGRDQFRYGLNGAAMFGPVDVKVWYAAHQGKLKITTASTVTSVDNPGNMIQGEVGYNLPNIMASRFFLRYHVDSGDSDNSDNGTDGGKFKTYDPYFTEKHDGAGMMDLFGWGNLTYYQLGWTAKPGDKTEVGLQGTVLSRTQSGSDSAHPADTFNPGTYGGFLPVTAASNQAQSVKMDASALGTEYDLWATEHYDANLSTTLRVGYFMPGSYYKDGAVNPAKDSIMHVMAEVRATF